MEGGIHASVYSIAYSVRLCRALLSCKRFDVFEEGDEAWHNIDRHAECSSS
jgi:hypothetical protein